ncbi:MAG: MFS transporter [Bacteroidales bacterium]|nr:MFS transporter [Bacteroidales bacterium]
MSEKASKIYPWVVVGLLSVVAFLNYLDRQMLSTMQAAIGADIVELQHAQNFGRLMAIFLWIYAVVSPFAGSIADRLSRKWLIVGSLGVWSLVTLLMGHCQTFTQMYWLRGLMGVSEALYIPSSLSLIADYHAGKSRSLAVGLHMTGLYLGQAVGGFGAIFANALSWRMTFQWFGIIGVLYAAVLVFCLKEKREISPRASLGRNDSGGAVASDERAGEAVAMNERSGEAVAMNERAGGAVAMNERSGEAVILSASEESPSIFRSFGLIFSNIAFWVILFFFASTSLPGWGTKNWLPTLFAQHIDGGMAVAGPVATITIAVASFIGVMIGGPLSDRWVRKNLRGRIYTSAIGLSMMIPALLLMGLGKGLVPAVASGLIFGLGYGMFDTNNMPILCQFVPSRLRATAYGLMNMVGVAMGALCTQLLGRIPNLGLSFAVLGGVTAIALILQLTILHPTTDDMK